MKARYLMAGVFISYRREDSPGHAGRLFDRVRARFGADTVFMDVTAIDAGVDFVEAIDRAVGTCDVLLAIIGPQWLGAADDAGRKRLDNPNDFIRLEIAGALKRNVRVVPVLVDEARLPAAADLPEELQPLLRRNAVELRDARWDTDIEQLIASLTRVVKAGDGPLRLEAPPRRRWQTAAALVVLAVGVGAAVVFGPRGCAPGPAGDVTTGAAPSAVQGASAATPAAASPTNANPTNANPTNADPTNANPSNAAPDDGPKAPVTAPNVVGRPLSEAREMLRRAGVDVARTLYRDDRLQAVDSVLLQTDVRTSAGSRPAVALTVVARAAVAIHHRPEDADTARGLLGALTASRVATGLAIRTLEMPAVRPESLARVGYRDETLAATAADLAKDANTWLEQSDRGRTPFTAAMNPRVAPRTIIIGLPERGGTGSSTSGPLPDVRGLTLAEARRLLTAAGVATVDAKWLDDAQRKPLEVVGQTALPGRVPGTRVVVLDVVARGALIVEYAETDRALVARFAPELTDVSLKLGLLPRLRAVKAVKPGLIGRVMDGGNMEKEAISIAGFASRWLTKERGRRVSIRPATDATVPSRTMLFGIPEF